MGSQVRKNNKSTELVIINILWDPYETQSLVDVGSGIMQQIEGIGIERGKRVFQ